MNQPLDRKLKRRFRLRTLLGLIVIMGIGYGFYQWRQYQHERELRLLLAQIDADDPGWRWEEINAERPIVAENEDPGKKLIATSALLGIDNGPGLNKWGITYNDIQCKNGTIYEYVDRYPAHRIQEDLIASMRSHLLTAPGPEGLRQLRELRHLNVAILPSFDNAFVFTKSYPGWWLPFQATRLLLWDTEMQLDAQQSDTAVDNVSTMLTLTRWFNHDPYPRTSDYGPRVAWRAKYSLQRTLAQASHFSGKRLLDLQFEFLQADQETISVEKFFRKERACIEHDLRLLHEGKVVLDEKFLGENLPFLSTFWHRLDRFLMQHFPTFMIAYWCRPLPWAQERAEALKYCNETIAWSRLPDHELLPRFRQWQEPVTRCPPFTFRFFLGSDQKFYDQQVDHQVRKNIAGLILTEKASIRICATSLACERYRLDHGRWPVTWEQLVPHYLNEPLNDPYTGQPLKLKAVADGLIVYSVGFNEKDDEGDVLSDDDHNALDLGIRLWNPDRRRQPPKRVDNK